MGCVIHISDKRIWTTEHGTGRVRRLIAAAILASAATGAACARSPIAPAPPGPVDGTLPTPLGPTPIPPPTLSVTRILAFGDSITEGVVSPAFQSILSPGLVVSYPYKLQERLTATYTAQTIVVMNAGRAGEWAAQGVRRLPDVIREAQPDVLLLLEGVNDLNNNAGISPTIGAIESMIKYAKAQGLSVFVATLLPQRRGGLRARSVDSVPGFNDAVRKTAAEAGATLVDVNRAFDLAWIGQDGLHPTEAGYSHLADIFFAAIRSQFQPRCEPVVQPCTWPTVRRRRFESPGAPPPTITPSRETPSPW